MQLGGIKTAKILFFHLPLCLPPLLLFIKMRTGVAEKKTGFHLLLRLSFIIFAHKSF